MMQYIIYYFSAGLAWLILHELLLNGKMTTGLRARLFLFWPVTLFAWIIGFLDAMYYSFFDDEDF
jgi:hypothetical protein